MKRKNNAIHWIVGIYIIFLLADLYTTYINKDIIQYLELNPIYRSIGIWGIFGVNLIIVLVMWRLYIRSKNPTLRFIWIQIFLLLCLIRIPIIISNYHTYLHPPSIELLKQITPAMRQAEFSRFYVGAWLPYLSGLFTFFIYKIDHIISFKVKE